MNSRTIGTVVLLATLLIGTARSADNPLKKLQLEAVVNDSPAFMIRVDVDSKDRVYREGEKMRVRAQSEKDCYMYVLYYSGDQASVLFPNKYDKDNHVLAKQVVEVPRVGTYNIVCRPPFGTEVLHVIATSTPVKLFDEQKEKQMATEQATEVDASDLKGMVSKIQSGSKDEWAEARIAIQTTGAGQPSKKSRNFAVCVGISEYKDQKIQDLKVSHLDAQRMAKALHDLSGVEEPIVLLNEQATRAAIEKAIFKDLVEKSSAGDTVFIFFSGHGGRCADTNGDEPDGVDEYLVPADGILGKPDTMIVDDTFARWIQELDGRKVCIILDSCHSGGSSKECKGIEDGVPTGPADFFDGEIKRSKDLGQTDTVVLAACQANQLAWEIPGADSGSVMTNFLLKAMRTREADKNNDNKLSVKESYDYIKSPISELVQTKFNAQQDAVLIDNSNDSVFFKGDVPLK